MLKVCVLICGFTACGSNQIEEYVLHDRFGGWPLTLRVRGLGELQATQALKEAHVRVWLVMQEFSRQLEDSALRRLEALAPQEVVFSDDGLQLISYACELAKRSQGLYDPSSEPLLRWYGWRSEGQQLPTLTQAQALVNWQDIVIDPVMGVVKLNQPGMSLSLGALIAGLAADRGAKVLKQAGASVGVVELGPVVKALGDPITLDWQGQNWELHNQGLCVAANDPDSFPELCINVAEKRRFAQQAPLRFSAKAKTALFAVGRAQLRVLTYLSKSQSTGNDKMP